VQTAVTVEHHTISLRLVLITSSESAASLERSIQSAVDANTGVVPDVSITAVPDEKSLATIAMSRATAAPAAPTNNVDVTAIRDRIRSAIDAEWPAAAAGPLAGWDFVVPGQSTPTIVVKHLGQPLGVAAESLLASQWSTQVGTQLQVRDVFLTDTIATERLGREREWLASVSPMLAWAGDATHAFVCVKAPIDSTRKLTAAQQAALSTIRASAPGVAGRLALVDSSGWSLRVAIGDCTAARPDSAQAKPAARASP
jgi:hypothetical protein